MWYYLLAFVVTMSNLSLILRQAFGVDEVTMLIIVVGTFLSAGVLFIIVTVIAKALTGGCYGINEWWLFLAIMGQLSTMIINEMTFETVSPVMAVPFFFLYPSITIRARGREASIAGAVTSVVTIIIVLICYYIVTMSPWWRGEYGVVFSGSFWDRLYIFVTAGFVTAGATYLFIALLPIGLGGFYLPGYYVWRYKDTAIVALIIYVIVLMILFQGGLIRAIVNAGYRSFGID